MEPIQSNGTVDPVPSNAGQARQVRGEQRVLPTWEDPDLGENQSSTWGRPLGYDRLTRVRVVIGAFRGVVYDEEVTQTNRPNTHWARDLVWYAVRVPVDEVVTVARMRARFGGRLYPLRPDGTRVPPNGAVAVTLYENIVENDEEMLAWRIVVYFADG